MFRITNLVPSIGQVEDLINSKKTHPSKTCTDEQSFGNWEWTKIK